MKPQEFWTNKHPKSPIIYEGRAIRGYENRINIDVRNMIWEDDHMLSKVVSSIKGSADDKAMWCQQWTVRNITYISDKASAGISECWQFPNETLVTRRGDCIAEYEKIYTIDGVKSAKDIKVGDQVLSYDFDNKKFVYKPIVKKWDKGELPVKRVHLRNGQYIDVTDNHHMLMRTNQTGDSIYKQKDLKDVDLTRWWKRKAPIAKKIPYGICNIADLTVAHCYIIGHFIAEGWVSDSHVNSSGYELIEYIIPLLEKYNIPFSEYKNNSGVTCIRFLKSDFKDYLKFFKTNSFDIHIPEEIFHLPDYKLEALLDGMWLGDGTKKQYTDSRGYQNNKEWTYSTSSEQLSRDIQRIGLQLGRSFHIWKQEDHQGAGTKPIYRINYNPSSHFLKYYGYTDISEVSISYIEDLDNIQCYDWEVEETHNFVFVNGLITRQCEDGSILMASLMLNAEIPNWRVRVTAGLVESGIKAELGGHAYVTYCREVDNQWVVLDWCYREDSMIAINGKPIIKNRPEYKQVWFSFNNKYAWSHTEYGIIQSLKIN